MSYFVHDTSVVDEGAEIGDDTSIWFFSHIRSKAKIGKNCHIGQNVYIDDYVSIGDGCKIQNNVSVYDGVILENDVFVGPSAVFTNDINPRAFIKKGHEKYKTTIVEEGATIGANATIVCGNRIGKYALVAAGAVVTTDVPDFTMVAGVPAMVIGTVDKSGNRVIKE